MEMRNLDRNILFYLCEELTDRNSCDSLAAELIYQTFSDIPDENIARAIQSMTHKGWIEEDMNQSRFYVTNCGRSKIRSIFPDKLLPNCEMPIK
jgi:hypothetical protein